MPIDPVRSAVLHRFLDAPYPNIVAAAGVWLTTAEGERILDACSGGAMAVTIGYGRNELAEVWASQAERLPYVYDEQFANSPRDELAARLVERAAPRMPWVRFATGGSEANEAALRLVRQHHVERGEDQRWLVVSPAQAYHGSTMGTLALTGRPRTLHHPFEPYLVAHRHIPPATERLGDPSGEAALAALDAILEEAGDQVAAVFMEPVSAAALPGYSPPARFLKGVAERRERYGFLVVFDEVVTGLGRVGTWLAADQLPLAPDVVTLGKGLGGGYAPISAMLATDAVVEPIREGSGYFDLGHTWDGAPLSAAVGLAVLDILEREGLVDRVAAIGDGFVREVQEAVGGIDLVGEVRGRGLLVGIELVDPRDGHSILPAELDAAALADDVCVEHGLLVTSSHPNADGMASDQMLLAPAFVVTEAERAQMVERLAGALVDLEGRLLERLKETS